MFLKSYSAIFIATQLQHEKAITVVLCSEKMPRLSYVKHLRRHISMQCVKYTIFISFENIDK